MPHTVSELVHNDVVVMVVGVTCRAQDVVLKNHRPRAAHSGDGLELSAVKGTCMSAAPITATCDIAF